MKQKYTKFEVQHPIWAYLNQPIFDRKYRTILNPKTFCYQYRIQWLEFCLNHESIELLERCLDRQSDAREDNTRSLPSNTSSSH